MKKQKKQNKTKKRFGSQKHSRNTHEHGGCGVWMRRPLKILRAQKARNHDGV